MLNCTSHARRKEAFEDIINTRLTETGCMQTGLKWLMTIVLSVMNLLIILLWSRVLVWTEHVHFLLSLFRVVFALSARLCSV